MAAKEVRELRTISKKLVMIEEKNKLLLELRKKKICLPEEEMFVQNLHSKFKILGERRGVIEKQRSEFVSLSLKYKIRDNNLHGVKVRKKRDYLWKKLETEMGKKSSGWKCLLQEIKANSSKLRVKLKDKYKKKVVHLTQKYGVVGSRNVDIEDSMMQYMGRPKVFVEEFEPVEI